MIDDMQAFRHALTLSKTVDDLSVLRVYTRFYLSIRDLNGDWRTRRGKNEIRFYYIPMAKTKGKTLDKTQVDACGF